MTGREAAHEAPSPNAERFVWPPRTDATSPDATGPGIYQPRRHGVPSPAQPGVIAAIESVFLGTSSLALGGAAPWTPEPTDDACPRCGRSVGVGEVSPDDGCCTGCRPEKLRWERMIRLGEFDGALRKAVLETKYGAWRRQGTLLGRMLGERVGRALDAAGIPRERTVLAPVPMPWIRRMRRGIDHSTVIARGVSTTSGCRLVHLLKRKNGPVQASLEASARAKNVQALISRSRRTPGDAEIVILIDDVRTTGATLDACCRALEGDKTASSRVWAGVVSCAVEGGRRRSEP